MSTLKRWTGTAWEGIDNGAKVVGGMGGQLLSEQVLAADASSITFSNLNSLTDGDYTFELALNYTGGASNFVSMFFNGNVTPTNYYSQYHMSENTVISGAKANNATICGSSITGTLRSYITGTIKIHPDGYITILAHASEFVGSSTYFRYSGRTIISTFTVSSITEIKLSTATATILAGSKVKLYGSKIATNLVSVDPIDHTNFTTDRLLKVGETATITYTNAVSAALHIQTVEGLYEVDIIGATDSGTYTNGYITLAPNAGGLSNGAIDSYRLFNSANTTTTSPTAFDGYRDGDNFSTFYFGYQHLITAHAKISTFTTGKNLMMSSITKTSASVYGNYLNSNQIWNDVSTPWTSLGKITFPFAQSGKIIIRRII